MIEKIAHLSDIHIRKIPTRNSEYEKVFENLYKSLKKQKPDRIVVVGDLVHDYIDLQGEQLIMAGAFLNALAEIAPVRITRGNHDMRKKNLKRVDTVRALVNTIDNPNIIYYDKTDFFIDDNIMWAVWNHGQPKNNPWKTKEGKKINAYRNENNYTLSQDKYKSLLSEMKEGKKTIIDLFHDPITGCESTTGFEMKSVAYYKISDFLGDISLLGDIHLKQFLDKKETKAYCGSLISQDFSEGDDKFHGYLIWDVEKRKAEEIPIANDYSFKTVDINPYTDFDDLEFEIENPTKVMKVRFMWNTLIQTRTKDAERKLIEYVKSKYKDCIFTNKNNFIIEDKIDIDESVTLDNINSIEVQEEIFREYLDKIGCTKEEIADVMILDTELSNEIEIGDDSGIEWSVVKFGGSNFMSYEKIDVDWRKMEGLFQITGINTSGKTSILKLLTYVLFGKTLETETRMKYGDKRFVNNRNGAQSCFGYIVIEANGEYYGIKKITKIEKNRNGEIKGAPTTLSYYLLNSPDDEMTDENALEKFDEDIRAKTQKKIDAIIGTYDNFMRIVMTTSDTLNRVLSKDMAEFIDSLLFDSGLDIFDKKLDAYKTHQKAINEKSRVTCNVETTNTANYKLGEEIKVLDNEIDVIEITTLPAIQDKIVKGRKYVDDLNKKLYNIDDDIYNLDVDETNETISTHNTTITTHDERKVVIDENILPLKETYDDARLTELNQQKEDHKTEEYNRNLEIKKIEGKIITYYYEIQVINGKVHVLSNEGAALKKDIIEIKEGKTCPTCGQELSDEHQEHINKLVKEKEVIMFAKGKDINKHKDGIKTGQDVLIKECNVDIKAIEETTKEKSLGMEDVLIEIGNLTNDKNDVEKRKELQTELDAIPTKIQNEELNIKLLQQKIDNHENSLKQIEENKKIEIGLKKANDKITLLETDESDEKENVYIKKTDIGNKQLIVKNNELLIAEFKLQEYRDNILNLYKKCVHRDGIPRQMLSNYVVPKINLTLEKILSVAPFKVWLDIDDLRPKLAYINRPEAIIDCISACGKERTFASVVLKFALNQINVKSKPTMFLLDEVMGKLDVEGSVEEFVEVLQMIKESMNKVLVIEQHHEINPDYLIRVELDEKGISTLKIT